MHPVYLIIGDGRVARHFGYYFSLLQIKYYQYSRKDSAAFLSERLSAATHVLVLIKDAAIDGFITEHLLNYANPKILIHFSGALTSKYAYAAHPLMTFSYEMYDLATYRQIPFVCDNNTPPFGELLPGLTNKPYYIDPLHKSQYHALCVVANNFTTILWQAVNQRFKTNLDLDFNVLQAILRQTCHNISQDVANSLTGPLCRQDQATINKHLQALANDPIADLYHAFCRFYAAEHSPAGLKFK